MTSLLLSDFREGGSLAPHHKQHRLAADRQEQTPDRRQGQQQIPVSDLDQFLSYALKISP